ncbi:archaetidylinositol phosphate synthase [Pyrobaculum aerophilum]|uniref:CDP-alcohol phosphatidyltransferase family protein n=1 Tax=Pyrobaculum aerophilum TaxID=13773 RepID=A0A832W4R0_9CREN|nr:MULTISPECIES: archaetidylinositol phosphate synthase [Pyrobaculum]MCX8136400.1 archaetidylinositol phosphate synthase [Pyrobaculum aerophilum]HII47229.1 CDP-alcohol phosphatidyltransferase family protein [Pyrobaculum aerophilum]
MVLERLRKRLNFDAVGRHIPINPNALTLLSALLAWIGVPLVWIFNTPPWLLIAISGALDVIDGAVARGRGLASRGGAFIDSFLDRYSDAAYLLYFWNYVDPLAIFLALVGTFAISYARCRGESLGVEVRGVGFMERGERLLFLLAISLIIGTQYATPLFYLYTILVNSAAAYRGYVVYRRLTPNK